MILKTFSHLRQKILLEITLYVNYRFQKSIGKKVTPHEFYFPIFSTTTRRGRTLQYHFSFVPYTFLFLVSFSFVSTYKGRTLKRLRPCRCVCYSPICFRRKSISPLTLNFRRLSSGGLPRKRDYFGTVLSTYCQRILVKNMYFKGGSLASCNDSHRSFHR